MRNIYIILLMLSIFPISSVAQDKALNLQIKYNNKSKDIVFTFTNKVENRILILNDVGANRGSLFFLKVFDVKGKCILRNDYVYSKVKNEFQKRFAIQPGETITFIYNLADLIKNSLDHTENVNKIEIESWLLYAIYGQENLTHDKLKKSFDY